MVRIGAIALLGGLLMASGVSAAPVSRLSSIELNEGWEMRQVGQDAWHKARVPGTVHLDLMREGLIPDPFVGENETTSQWIGLADWEYRTTFDVVETILDRAEVDLVFEGLDTYARVYLNGDQILDADNMFRRWRIPVRSRLKIGHNELRVVFRSPIKEDLPKVRARGFDLPATNDTGEKTSPYTRKAPYHFGWDWGPRLVTSGIWKPVRLEAWDGARIADLFLDQRELTDERAKLVAHVEIEGGAGMAGRQARLVIEGVDPLVPPVERTLELEEGPQEAQIEMTVDHPRLWWPNGLGVPALSTFEARVVVDDVPVHAVRQRIGFRTLELRREPDRWGRSFTFVVNGVPVFAKGANWIPADSFTPRVDLARYRQLLGSARDAHMNMLRVWGGGIYEDDAFYDTADEMGIMLWQDFMFACSLYPADRKFLNNVEHEAEQQVRRLRHHPSIVLWCGNNEIEGAWDSWGWQEGRPAWLWDDYKAIFHGLLQDVTERLDPGRPYWPSSPSANLETKANSMENGDVHYWGVWHGKEPFDVFERIEPRFLSEYGFQSFPEMATILSYAQPQDLRIDSPVMLSHQKSGPGNQLIKTYMLREYPEPKDFAGFLYVSQVLQAEGIKRAAENLRRSMPRTMGSLYWQLDDCWPVASWSSIDYFGRWKALQYYARRFYADLLVTAKSTGKDLEVFVVSDRREPVTGQLSVELMDFDGSVIHGERRQVSIAPLASERQVAFPFVDLLGERDRRSVFVRLELSVDDRVVSSNDVMLAPYKELKLPRPTLTTGVKADGDGFSISVESDRLARHVRLTSAAVDGFFGDNYFDVLPGRPVRVGFTPKAAVDLETFRKGLAVESIVDAFQ